LTLKIADFGLSRQLYHCYNYRKNSDEPLPWRWLAFESLTDLHFSTESDVWSYGITVWELFSCCEVPYGGYSYSTEFLREIQNNCLRPERPAHASVEM
jgi:receptor tyrosine kinase-like orphan receptor 1